MKRTQCLLKKLRCGWTWGSNKSKTKQIHMCQRGEDNFTLTLQRHDVTVTTDSFGECKKRKKELKMIPYTHKTKEIRGRKSN